MCKVRFGINPKLGHFLVIILFFLLPFLSELEGTSQMEMLDYMAWGKPAVAGDGGAQAMWELKTCLQNQPVCNDSDSGQNPHITQHTVPTLAMHYSWQLSDVAKFLTNPFLPICALLLPSVGCKSSLKHSLN